MTRRAGAAVAVALAFAACTALGPGGEARAHIVYGTETLRGLVAQADVVALVRILDPGIEEALGEPLIVGDLLEAIKGAPALGPLHFAQHGHGVPIYEKDQVVVVFLQRTQRSRELGALAGRVEWISIQEGDALEANPARSAALRAYAALEKLPAAERARALRQITLQLLASPDAKLASSAVRDIALARDSEIIAAEDLPALEQVLASREAAIGVRIALLAELERRGLVDGPPQWVKLLHATTGSEQIAVVRALAAHPSPPVTRELVALLASPEPLLVSIAAVSLGTRGNAQAVEPLGKLLASGGERARMSAIRGLGRIGTPAALAVLSEAAAGHPDAATRRRAGAELARQGVRESVEPGPGAAP